MEGMPDISRLYQKKYLPQSKLTERDTKQSRYTTQRFRLISNRSQSKPMIKCVKIFRSEEKPRTCELRSTSQHIQKELKENKLKNQLKLTRSVQLPEKSCQLMRQIMRLSNQELGDLETSVGGQRKLLDMFKVFFKRKNQTRQKERQQRKTQNFKPLLQGSHTYTATPRQRLVAQIAKNKKKRENMTNVGQYEKDLTPWNNPDIDFIS